MNLARERLLLGLLMAGMPIALYFLSIRPSVRRARALNQRITQAHSASPFQTYTPVGQAERSFLDAAEAPRRSRLPVLAGDAAQMAHLHRVVSELNATLRAGGVRVIGVRASWDPVEAKFTLPAQLTQGAAPAQATQDAPELKVEGWALVVEIGGTTGDLFKALALLPKVNSLLEPVGLRWGQPSGAAAPSQFLILRNVYLQP